MKYDHQYTITYALNEPFDVNYVNRECSQRPNSNVLIIVQNTKGITSDMIRRLPTNCAIRIAGGYDKSRIARYGKDIQWSSNYYFEATTYSKNETIRIIEEMEKIESEMSPDWSDIQKVVFIYDKLKRGIMYDPKYEQKSSNEIRSLRGLISGQTVCAGYAMILKEFMDRNNISCEYVEGYTRHDKHGDLTGGHAWNIINIEGKKYPIDLTWDNTEFRSGKRNSVEWLGQDVQTFARHHFPLPGEETHDYTRTLSQINPAVVRSIQDHTGIGRITDYKTTSYWSTRDDGTRFLLCQLGSGVVNNKTLYRYYFAEITPEGKRKKPLILFSETNVTELINCKRFNKDVTPGLEHAIDNYLFSRENIGDSLRRGTCYIGGADKSKDENQVKVVNSAREIQKDPSLMKELNYDTKAIVRSDGSVILAQKVPNRPFVANGVAVYRFDLFEMVKENNREVLKRNTIYSEVDFLLDDRKGIADDYLSRDRIERKVKEAGGYMGYYSKKEGSEYGSRTYDPNLSEYFKITKKVDIKTVEDIKRNRREVRIPSFEEVRELARKYTIDIDFDNPGSFAVLEEATGKVVTDPLLCDQAIFANLWLASAGVKRSSDEKLPGEQYAFNSQANGLYNYICRELANACKNKGVIDTVEVLRNVRSKIPYKYDEEIIIRLFRTPYQTEFINRLFLQSQGINKRIASPETLYSESRAAQLLYGDDNSIAKAM